MRNTPLSCGALVASLALSAVASAQTDSARLEQLEQQVTALQQRAAKPQEESLRFNGFFSTGVSMANNDAGYAGITEQTDVENLSLFGLQGSFKLAPQTEVVMQLVSRGTDDWDPKMEWAYISHKVSNNLTARAGRLRLPVFMYSDSLDVGYSQPWARPPVEVYGEVPVSNHTGVDLIYDWHLASSTVTTQVYYGHSKQEDIDLRNGYGAEVSWSDFTWKLRANYGSSEVDLGSEVLDAAFIGVGAGYDDGSWQVVSELTRIKVDGVLADPQSAYITVARRSGAFAPYITLAHMETQDNDERPLGRIDAFTAFGTPGSPMYGNPGVLLASELQNRERSSVSLGLRWDATSKVALKFDATRVGGFGDTGGGLDSNMTPVVEFDNSTVYTVKIDSAF